MVKHEIQFTFERLTKNMVRYTEVANGAAPKIGTLYVAKTAFPEGAPVKLTVTVEG